MRSISKGTFAEQDGMVHFVSARSVLESGDGIIFPERKINEIKNVSKKQNDFSENLDEAQMGFESNNFGHLNETGTDLESFESSPSSGGIEERSCTEWIESFNKLENSLRTFVLEKRTKSKLAPAKIYMENVLSDLTLIAQHNIALKRALSSDLGAEISAATPFIKQMVEIKSKYLDSIDFLIESNGSDIYEYVSAELTVFIDDIEQIMNVVEWDGILSAGDYAYNLHAIIVHLADIRLKRCSTQAQQIIIEKIDEINSDIQHCFPIDILVDKTPISQGFQMLSFSFNLPMIGAYDVLRILKDFVPGISMIATGVFGLRSIGSSTKILKLSKLSLSFLAVGGKLLDNNRYRGLALSNV